MARSRTDWMSICLAVGVGSMDVLRLAVSSIDSWPYLNSLDSNTTVNFFAYTKTTRSIGSISSTAFAGFVSNWLGDTKKPMIFGHLVALFASLLYVSLELFSISSRSYAFLFHELIAGVSGAFINVWKIHMVMASTEKDRSRVISTGQLAILVGFTIGPMINSVFAKLFYPPGPLLPWQTHFNLYTASGYFNAITCVVGLLILFFIFDGRMRSEEWENGGVGQEASENTVSTIASRSTNEVGDMSETLPQSSDCKAKPDNSIPVDYFAIFICLLVRIAVVFSYLYLITIKEPYLMMVFQWTGQETSYYFSLASTVQSILGLIITLGFFFNIFSRFSERKAIMLAITVMISFYLVTYPWPFLPNTIPYEKWGNGTDENGTETRSQIERGCKPIYAWCSTTTAINPIVYFIAMIFLLGSAMPFCELNLDILYSKILGPIKQGTMQGIFMATGDFFSIVGPIALSNLYEWNGPKPVWLFEIGYAAATLIICGITYRRLISYTKRLTSSKSLKLRL